MYKQRLQKVRQEITRTGVDGIILTDSPTVRWATGLDSSNALLYVTDSETILMTDGRYIEAARQVVTNAEAAIGRPGSLARALAEKLGTRAGQAHRLGFAADHVTIGKRNDLQMFFPGCALVPLTGFLQEARVQKSPEEIEAMTRAQAITDAVFGEILAVIKPGIAEKELVAELVYRQLQHGAEEMSFWPIVASGPNTALPHVKAGDRKTQKNDVVLLDFGCTVDGYCSDMTRTVHIGAPSPKFRKVYATVLKAQQAALGAAKAGLAASELDATARKVIKADGYDIPHGLGHSLGLEAHEWPAVNPRTYAPLSESAVITIEPGIYLPGEFGVRIEDMIVLQPEGCRSLTTSPKELIIL
ncbi:MAG TPA: Xaa-Pro peptidase family protein [Candidatus Saccharimonadales bacterium]|nr:Xaa-Pro peptidase family protein [Candidatus Saccharimonadales bacterium]